MKSNNKLITYMKLIRELRYLRSEITKLKEDYEYAVDCCIFRRKQLKKLDNQKADLVESIINLKKFKDDK